MEATEPKQVWARIDTTYVGPLGSFLAGETRQTTEAVLKAIAKEINVRRAALPKDQRVREPAFRYEIVPAPWDRQKDWLSERLENAAEQIADARSKLDQLRSSHRDEKRCLTQFTKDLAEFDKISPDGLQQPPVCFYRRSILARIALCEAQIGLMEYQMAEHGKAIETLQDMIGDFSRQMAERISIHEKENGTKTQNGTDPSKDGADTQGQDAAAGAGQE